MNSRTLWTDKVPDKDGIKSSINDIAISPDGSRIVVAVGNRVLLYNGETGDLIESLRVHKDTVTCVDFSSDGSRFASGGADNVVVIWKNTGQGLLRYNHTSSVQRVKYNPLSLQLVSCADADFGFWNPDEKQVAKEKVGSKILAAAWSPDGSFLAIGMQSGTVSIRNQQAEEVHRIERKAPVWCLAFVPGAGQGTSGGASSKSGAAPSSTSASGTADGDILAVGTWDKSLSMYRIQGNNQRLVAEKALRFYPCDMALAGSSASKSTANQSHNHLVVSGSNKKVMLFSRDGVHLADIANKDAWVWAVSVTNSAGASSSLLQSMSLSASTMSPADFNRVALGTDNGVVDAVLLNFGAIHALYREKYTYRESLTEIIVQNLVNDKKVKIRCKDLVKRVALYKNKLAVQLTDRVCIYESNAEEALDMHFRNRKERIMIGCGEKAGATDSRDKEKGTSMVVTSNHLVFCRGDIMEVFALDGQRLRVWNFDAAITVMKVDGGLEGREGILLGLQNGAVVKVFVDNPFPLELYDIPASRSAVVDVDTSLYRTFLAVISTANQLTVMDVRTKEVYLTRDGVASVCFNTEVDDMLCYTSLADSKIYVLSSIASPTAASKQPADVTLSVASPLSIQEQLLHVTGHAIGFQGQKIYYLQRGLISGTDVPQGSSMFRALEGGDVRGAYRIACLGATEADWKLLAIRALRQNYLDVAKSAFARLKDTKYIGLLEQIERSDINSQVGAFEKEKNVAAPQANGRLPRNRGGADTNIVANTVLNSTAAFSNNTTSGRFQRPYLLDPVWQAELIAYEGHHIEAAKTLSRAGRVDGAIRLLTDLRRWEDAKLFAQNAGRPQSEISELIVQQAKWLHEICDWKGAAELYSSMGQHMQAAKIVVETSDNDVGWPSVLIDIVRACPTAVDGNESTKEILLFCGNAFMKSNEDAFAKETFVKAGDISQLMSLYVKRQMWTEAAKLADDHEGKFDVSVFLPYAEWLLSQDQYEEAMTAFRKAGRQDLAKNVLEELTFNAVSEARFKDASYYYWLLSRESDDVVGHSGRDFAPLGKNTGDMNRRKNDDQQNTNSNENGDNHESLAETGKFSSQQLKEFEVKADLYYAYASVHTYVTDPFTSSPPETLFQVSRYIINTLGSSELVPFGVSRSATLYTLARQAMSLGAFKLARNVYERLSKLQFNPRKQEDVELDMLIVQAKPMRDDPDTLPVCYRCSSINPLLNTSTNKSFVGDVCTSCGHPFIRSFMNFEILPLVEFVPDPNVSDEEAIDLIRQQPGTGINKHGRGRRGGWKEGKVGDADTLMLDDDADDIDEANPQEGSSKFEMNAKSARDSEVDLFMRCVNATLERQHNVYVPTVVDANTLLSLKRSEVYVRRSTSKNRRATFYRNMLPEIPIAISQPCHRFFHLEDFEFAYLSNKSCPYSRLKNVGEYGSL